MTYIHSCSLYCDRPACIKQQRDKLREALAQPEQEPVAYPEGDVVGPCICGIWPGGKCLKCPRITTPPQRKPLTNEEIYKIYRDCGDLNVKINIARAIEAAHGIKENT